MEIHGLLFKDPWGDTLSFRADATYGAVNLTRTPSGWRAWVVDAKNVPHEHHESTDAVAAVLLAVRPFEEPF